MYQRIATNGYNHSISYLSKAKEFILQDRKKTISIDGLLHTGTSDYEYNYSNWNILKESETLEGLYEQDSTECLLDKIKRMYPIGTKFYPAQNSQTSEYCIITNTEFMMSEDNIYSLTDESKRWSEEKKYGNTDLNRVVYHNGKWATIVEEAVKCKPIESTKEKTLFNEGDYIVTLGVETNDFKAGFVYKQRDNSSYLRPCIDTNGNKNNGWGGILFSVKKNWRYATAEEIAMYDKANIPINTVNMDEILKEAKKRYPTGTKVKSISSGCNGTINWENMPSYGYESPYIVGINIHLGIEENKGGSRAQVFDGTNWAEVIEEPKSSTNVEVFPGIYIGDIVVSLKNISERRKIGDIFKVLEKSKEDCLYYKNNSSSTDEDSFRLATAKECKEYNERACNISDFNPPIEPTIKYIPKPKPPIPFPTIHKFKAGDCIIGNDEANSVYTITRKGWKGIVIESKDNKQIIVEGLEDKSSEKWYLNPEFFDLYTDALEQWRFKTLEEMLSQYGENWRNSKKRNSFISSMDPLLGKWYKGSPSNLISVSSIPNGIHWNISSWMITNKPFPPTRMNCDSLTSYRMEIIDLSTPDFIPLMKTVSIREERKTKDISGAIEAQKTISI